MFQPGACIRLVVPNILFGLIVFYLPLKFHVNPFVIVAHGSAVADAVFFEGLWLLLCHESKITVWTDKVIVDLAIMMKIVGMK